MSVITDNAHEGEDLLDTTYGSNASDLFPSSDKGSQEGIGF